MENNTNGGEVLCNFCVGYAYVPVQMLDTLYGEDEAMNAGTIFPALDLPMDCYGKVCRQEGGVCYE